MQPLDRDLRRKLESTIKTARDVAEAAARAALDQLGVGAAKPPAYLDEPQRELRRRLRAHGRQLGEGGALLAEEVAYQHWHRMLFARWLAENYLLMYPDPVTPVAVTLEDCAELAADEGAADAWDLAARYAAHMLPQIFRPTSPVFHLALPPEHQHALERLVENLDPAVFHSADGLGWVYQFWQSKRKDEVNAAEVKIGARELPAVTQLFTEPYMVSFLLDNALGAWWVGRRCGIGRGGEGEIGRGGEREIGRGGEGEIGRGGEREIGRGGEGEIGRLGDWRLGSGGEAGLTAAEREAREMLRTAQSEQELRDYFSLPGVPLTYLRFVREEIEERESGSAGERESVDDSLSPSPTLPLSPSMPPWRPAAGWFESWPHALADLKVLDPCCGSGHFLVAVFLMLVPMRRALEGLDAAAACEAVLRQNIHGLEIDARCVEIAAFALALAAWRYPDAGGYRPLPPLNLACSGLAIAAKKEEWLTLAQQAADALLADGAGETARNLVFWKNQVSESLWHTQIKAGMGALYDLFQDAPVLGSLINPNRMAGDFFRADYGQVAGLLRQMLAGEDSRGETYEMGVVAQGLAEAATLLAGRYHFVITNPPYLVRAKQSSILQEHLTKFHKPGDSDLATVFLKRFEEFLVSGGVHASVTPLNWIFLKSYRELRQDILRRTSLNCTVRVGSGATAKASWDVLRVLTIITNVVPDDRSTITGMELIAPDEWSRSQELMLTPIKTAYVSDIRMVPDCRIVLDFDAKSTLLEAYSQCFAGVLNGDSPRFQRQFWEIESQSDLWAFQQTTVEANKPFGGLELVLLYDKLNGHLREDAWIRRERLHDSDQRGNKAWGKTGIAVSQMRALPVSLYSGELFDSNIAVICPSNQSLVLPIWVYCQSEEYHQEVRRIDEKLNVTNATLVKVPFDLDHWTRIAAERYPDGLPKPYSPDPTQWIFHGHPADSTAPLHVAVARLLGYRWPAESDHTLELSDDARAWVERSTRLLPLADKDGIVCLPPVRGELSAADRLTGLLAAAYGDAWRGNTLDELLAAAGWAGKSLDSWLRTQFFADHCKLFHHRPFLWHVWDGLNDGFAALVTYHKLDRKNLETLIYTYVGDWISRQRRDAAAGVDGAQARLAAAETLKQRLELILHGEAPYDIFVRWKPLDQQPIGWDPDLNDGVRLNIRPWLSVPDVGKKGAGVLRDKPNIKWGKDRGKDVESAPWFGVFGGERINDWHLSLAEKRAARGAG